MPVRAAVDLKVIYVSAFDCPPCITWKNQYKDAWVTSPEYRRVTFVEITAPQIKVAYQERYWPPELHPVLDQLPRKSGVPRFLIVKDGKVVSNGFGVSKWLVTMADLKKLLET